MKDDKRQITDHRQPTSDKTWLAVLAVTLIAFILRVYRLDATSLRGDEAFTVIFVQRTWEGLWKGISTVEPNPPLMYLALRVWVALAGASEFATRYFSAFFGVLCVPLLFRLAKEMFAPRVIASEAKQSPTRSLGIASGRNRPRNDTVGFIAAFLIAINPYQIWHSQDVRNYTLWPALSLLALIFLWRWWRLEVGSWKLEGRAWKLGFGNWDLGFYVLATLASLYTHYYDVFVLIAENIFVFAFVIFNRRWRTLARWIGAQVVLVLAYAPWILFGTNRVTTYGEASAQQSISLLDQFSRTLATFVVGDTVPDILKAIVWLPLALVVAAILVYVARRNRERALFLVLWMAVPSLALYTISIGRPLFLERYLNAIAPAYYLVLAIGIGGLASSIDTRFLRETWYLLTAQNRSFTAFRTNTSSAHPQPAKAGFANLLQRFQSPLLVIAILFFIATSAYALTNYYFNPDYAKAPNWRALSNYIAARQQPGDIVIQNFTEMSAIYYRSDAIPVLTVPKDYWARPADEKTLRQLNTDYRRIWFIPALPDWWDPDQFVEKFLAHNDDRVLDTRVAEFRLQLYLTPREFESKIAPVNARVGDATLTGYRIEGTRTMHLVLYWRAERQIEKDFTVFVHLADANDRIIAQQDRAPAFGLYPTSAWQPGETIVDAYDLQVDAAPGTYALIVGMYDPATLVRAPAFDANGARLSDDRVILTQMTISQ